MIHGPTNLAAGHTSKCAGDWANALFSIALDSEVQKQFAFPWEGQQWTFQGLPQGYLHSLTICLGLVASDLVQWTQLPTDLFFILMMC